MNKLIPFLISSVLLVGAVGCENPEKSSSAAPDATNNETVQAPTQETAQNDLEDAEGETRRRQLNSDIRANEERNNALNEGSADRTDDALQSEVRSKLEANIPNGQLTVEAEEGAVIVAGTVPNEDQLQKIDPLARQIKGVKSVKVNAKVAPPTPEANENENAQ